LQAVRNHCIVLDQQDTHVEIHNSQRATEVSYQILTQP
jgi:hypothetical protein